MARYARETTVPAEKSEMEVKALLQRYGATQIATHWERDKSMIAFEMVQRVIRVTVHYQHRAEFNLTPNGRYRTEGAITIAWEQATRQRWRALLLILKAKLEAVESGLFTFEEEFLGQTVTSDGRTVYEVLENRLPQAPIPLMLPTGERP